MASLFYNGTKVSGGTGNSLTDLNLAPAFDSTKSYSKGACVLHDYVMYQANTAVSAGDFDSSQWDKCYLCNMVGSGGGSTSGGVTKLHYDLDTSSTKATSKTIDISGDYADYANITVDNISVEFDSISYQSSYGYNKANLTYSYDNSTGIITITSDSEDIPFTYNTANTIGVNVTIYGDSYVDTAPDLLWTNSDPTNNFNGQTISLDLSEYEGVIVEFNTATSISTLATRVYAKKTDSSIGTGLWRSNVPACQARNFTVSDSGVTFEYAHAGVSTNDEPAYMIPTKIYGVKGVVVEQVVGTTLWTNSDPTSAFSAQTISLDLSEYDAVEIEAKCTTNNETTNKFIYRINEMATICSINESDTKSEFRAITTYSTGIVFGAGYLLTWPALTTSASNGYLIPLTIKGVKL